MTSVSSHPAVHAAFPGANGKIAFFSNQDGDFTQIYVMNPDGSGVTRLTNNPTSDQDPAWSPDGTKIAFTRDVGVSAGRLVIYVMNPDGSGQTPLIGPQSDNPNWSPDGSRIAFTSDRAALFSPDIYVANADGSGQTRRLTTTGLDHYPAWSPDGTKIAFSSSRDGPREIYVMNPDGSGQTRRTNSPAATTNDKPDWQPLVDADSDGFFAAQGDCNDNDPSVHPGAQEVCNGKDDNCDGFTDTSPSGTPVSCDDGNACTTNDTCSPPGMCVGGAPLNCDNNNPCTTDSCDPTSGCVHTAVANGTSCSDGNACNGAEICQAGACTPGAAPSCDDGNACTADSCDPVNGCGHTPVANGTSCSDGNACNGAEICQAGACTPGAAVVCTASDQCHDAGTCDPGTGTCSNPAKTNGTACIDGNACTQTDTCQSGTCTGSDPVVCVALDQCHVAGICDPSSGTCSSPAVVDGTACSDGHTCTVADSCQAGMCTSGPFSWSDVLQPVNADGSSIFKLGSTIPVKFKLTGACAGITNLIAKIYVAKVSNNIVGTEMEATSTAAADSGNTFRYDPTNDQYIYNLATKSLSVGTWQIRIDLDNGAANETVLVSLR